MPDNEYKNHFIRNVENRLRKLENKAHVHNGDKKQSDLPKLFKDTEMFKIILVFLTVVIVGVIIFFTGTNPLNAL